MKILDRNVYVGPSHYAHFPVLEAGYIASKGSEIEKRKQAPFFHEYASINPF